MVGMLHRLADVYEQLQPLADAQVVLVAEIGDGDAADQLHHEVGAAGFRFAAVKDVSNVRMVHQGQGLALRLKSGHHLAGVHTRFEHLQGHFAPNRMRLLSHEDDAEAAFADLL